MHNEPKNFLILSKSSAITGGRKRTTVEVQCKACGVKSVMTADQAQRSTSIMHQCRPKDFNKPPRNKWLAATWV